MKLIAIVQEIVQPTNDFVIVKFKSDKSHQEFQIFISSPYLKKIRKYDELLLDVKFRSVVMKDLQGAKTYDTQLYTEMAIEVSDMMRKEYK